MNEIFLQAQALEGQLVEWRRWLHRHAELSFGEHATAAYIMRVLRAEGIECRPIAGTGVLARLEPTFNAVVSSPNAAVAAGGEVQTASAAGGSEAAPVAVVLRADIDALPICEATGLSFKSENEGIMHSCGHDMHAAALLGALVLLKRQAASGGLRHTVFGLFQPGEELLPGGATLVLAEDPFAGYDVKAFFGQHVEPDLPVGTFGMRAGEYMAATDELHIAVRGVGGHGALRGALKDPVKAAALLITRLLEAGNTPDSVLSIGRVEALGATNVVPDVVTMQGTLRTFGQEVRESLHAAILGEELRVKSGVDIDIEIRQGYPSVVNSPELCAHARDVFESVFGGCTPLAEGEHEGNVRDGYRPPHGAAACSVSRLTLDTSIVVPLDRRMTAEDFGFYTRRYPSLFYRVGVGHLAASASPPVGKLHTSAFNPSESALPFAAAALAALAINAD